MTRRSSFRRHVLLTAVALGPVCVVLSGPAQAQSLTVNGGVHDAVGSETYASGTVGSTGQGTLNIVGYGNEVTFDGLGSTALNAGQYAGSLGVINVSQGGRLNMMNWGPKLLVGDRGAGLMNVTDGGFVRAYSIILGNSYGSSGKMLVSGATSELIAGYGLTVGNGGNSELEVSDGGLAYSDGNIFIGNNQSTGLVTVRDGSRLSAAGSIAVGDSGNGVVNVLTGSTVTNGIEGWEGALTVGNFADSYGEVNVTGPGAEWHVRGRGAATVGVSGIGTMTISDGGLVDVVEAASSTIGLNESGAGTVTVTGQGSLIRLNGELNVGDAGAGRVILSDGGTLTASGVNLGRSATGSGTLKIGGSIEGDVPRGPGHVDAPWIKFGDGTGRVEFNHSDLSGAYEFATAISGAGAVDVYSGTTVLTGNNTYTGDTTVYEGTVRAGTANTLSASSSVTLWSNAELDLAGYDQTIAGLRNGGLVTMGADGTPPGTVLTIDGDYAGMGGTIAFNSVLGDDNSATDRMHVKGDTSGESKVKVKNAGGSGDYTTDGIKLIEIDGVSDGNFALLGDYAIDGREVVVGGVYGYTLEKGGRNGADGSWYLRSDLVEPPVVEPPVVEPPVVEPPVVEPPVVEPPVIDPPVIDPPVIDPPVVEPPVVEPPVVEPPVVDPDPEPEPETGTGQEPETDTKPPVVDPDPDPEPEPETGIGKEPETETGKEPETDTKPPVVDPDPDTGEKHPEGQEPGPKFYQAGAPVYEQYPQALQALNDLPTLRQRVGQHAWNADDGEAVRGTRVWGRVVGEFGQSEPASSTTGARRSQEQAQLQMGADFALSESDAGTLVAGVNGRYGTSSTDVSSRFGDGKIETDVVGVGATLTWYGDNGLYADAQAQYSRYESDLTSKTANRTLAKDNDGHGVAASVETGWKQELNDGWSLTPQAQLTYSQVGIEAFEDAFGADVSLTKGESLRGRLSVALDRETSSTGKGGKRSSSHLYAQPNLYYEFLDGSEVKVAGESAANTALLATHDDRLWGGLSIGGTNSWNDGKVQVFGEVNADTSLKNPGDSYNVGGRVGVRFKW